MIDHLAPSGRGEFEITDVLNHYIPDGGLFTRVYEGHWTDAGTVPVAAAGRGAGRATTTRPGGSPPPSSGRSDDGRRVRADRDASAASSSRAAPGSSARCYVRDVLGRRDGTRITVLDKLTYAGNRANLAPVEADPEQAARLRVRPGRHRRPGDRRAARRRRRRGRQLRRRVARRPEHPRSGGVPADRRHRRPRPARGRPRGVRRPASARSRYLQVSTDEVYGSVAEGRSRRGRDRLAPRSPYSAAKAAGELLVRSYVVDPRRRCRRHPRLEHVRPVPPSREAHPAVRHERDRRPAAAAVRRRPPASATGSTSPTTPAAIDHVLRHGASGETYNVPGSAEMTNRDVVAALLERLGKPWSLVRSVEDRPGHDRRYAMDGSKLAALGWRNRTPFDRRPGGDRRLVPRQRGLVARGDARATGTPSTSASTAAPAARRVGRAP